MTYIEDRDFSWMSGLYWTLTVMTTLGFGDITFHSDIGRLFSIIVLLSGVILLLIMLPFTFIQSFYAPWLEAQLHAGSPREVPPETKDHVIICKYDSVAPNLIKKLKLKNIPYYVIESDPSTATEMFHDGISVIYGSVESVLTYKKMLVDKASLVFANEDDTINTNIILTVREAAPDVPIVATADNIDSIDILSLSGATHVLPLKQMLGEKLANRISIGKDHVNIIGKFSDWKVIEFMVQDTNFSGKTLAETKLREQFGINIIGIWERGILELPLPNKVLSDSSVPVGIGTPKQIKAFNEMLKKNSEPQSESVLIIGGGKVGRAAGRALKEKHLNVLMIDSKKELIDVIGDIPDRLTIGNAADRHTLENGGLNESSLVILSTNQDAVNIYLSIYCRKLNPDLHIVSRITYARNLEAIHRAGADFVLSYAPLGAESVIAFLEGREPIIIGEEVELFKVPTPPGLIGKTLAESNIGALTGLVVLAVESEGKATINLTADYAFPANSILDVLGTGEQLEKLNEMFG